MRMRSSISVCKLLCRHPFRRFTKPKSPFSSIPFTTLANQCSTHPNPHRFHQRTSIISRTHFKNFQNKRRYSVDTENELDEINLKFAEAREEIESAMESKETVYFNEEAECARRAVSEVLDMYEGLLRKLSENERAATQRAIGLKMEQLKAELQQLDE